MATGTKTDFKIYNDQVHAGMIETLVQNTDAFNAASRNTIVMRTNRKRGEYDIESFFPNTADLVSRRDPAAVTAVTDTKITQSEIARVKLNRRIGPVAQTLDAFRKIGSQAGVNSLSFLIGTQIAKVQTMGWLNDGLLAARAALFAQATNFHDITGATLKTLNTVSMVDGLAKFGDAANRIDIWVMHSKPYYDLVKDQIAANMTYVSNVNVATATPITLNRPVLVTDSASLVIADGGGAGVNSYATFGLTSNAVLLEDSEEDIIHAELQTGLENLVVRLQGEYAFNMGLKGFTWDMANGGVNPNAGALGTGTNWDKVLADAKDLAGVAIETL